VDNYDIKVVLRIVFDPKQAVTRDLKNIAYQGDSQ
jgi:hypothetical protein